LLGPQAVISAGLRAGSPPSVSNSLFRVMKQAMKTLIFQQAGLLTFGSSCCSDLPISLLQNSGILRVSSPITAAGPFPNYTGFPFNHLVPDGPLMVSIFFPEAPGLGRGPRPSRRPAGLDDCRMRPTYPFGKAEKYIPISLMVHHGAHGHETDLGRRGA
jgi:hypothetical protein